MMSDPNYSITLYARDSFLKIEPLPLVITTPTDDKVYDGTALTKSEGASLNHHYWTANIGGEWKEAEPAEPGSVTLGTGETITFNVTGSQTPVGTSNNTYSIEWGENKSSNYKVLEMLGTLTVTEGTLTVTVKDIEKVYNGAEQEGRPFVATVTGTGETIEKDDYKIEGLGVGDVLTITYTPAKGTNVNGSPYLGSFDETSYALVNSEGQDAKGNYETKTFNPGTLTIKPKSVTIDATDNSKTYGDLDPALEAVVTGLVEGAGIVHTIAYEVVRAAGEDVGEYGMSVVPKDGEEGITIQDQDGEDVTANYDIKTEGGTFTINKKALTITVTDQEYIYNGNAQGEDAKTYTEGLDEKVTVEGLKSGDTLASITLDGQETNAGQYPEEIAASGAVIKNGNEDVTKNYEITYVKGNLTISKKALTISMADRILPYSGQTQYGWARTDEGKETISGLVNGETVTIDYIASSGKTVGTYENGAYDTATLSIKDGETDVTANYDLTSATAGKLTIEKDEKELKVASADKDWDYDAQTHTYKVYTVTYGDETLKGTEGQLEFTLPTGDKLTVTPTEKGVNGVKNVSDSGANSFTWTVENEDNYTKGDDTVGTLTIKPKTVTLTSGSKSREYNGSALTNEEVEGKNENGLTVETGWVGSEGATYAFTGTITTAGTVKNAFSYTLKEGTLAENYTIAKTEGDLTITANTAELSVASADGEWTYDGETHTNKTYTVTFGEETLEGAEGQTEFKLSTGDILTVVPTDKGLNGVKNVSDSGANSFTWTVENEANYTKGEDTVGTLTINPAAVTVTAKSEEFTYDGKAHSNAGYDVVGLVGDDAISAVVTGSITFPSESPVTNELTSYEFTKGTPGNYNVTPVNGELTMKTAEVAITIKAADDSKTYDGAELTNSSVTVTEGELLTGDTLVATATGSVTNVADTTEGNNPIAEGYKIMHGDNDVTENYVITPVAGTLTINPKAVTVTAQDKAFTYTGAAQSWPEYDVDGLVGDDAIEAVVTGSITFPSESPVTNKLESYEFTKGTAGNYTVTTKDGKLTMTNAEVAITITAASDEWTYDGTAHENTEVTVTSGNLMTGDELVAVATGSVTNVADTAAGNNPIAEGYKIMHGEEDVTANYAITTVAGKLTINPKAVTVTAQDKEFTYTGEAQSWPEYDVEGLVGDDAISAVVTGSITFPRESPVTNKLASYEFTAGTPGNYDVTTADGELTMKKAEVAITITAADDSKTYDGSALTNSSVTVTEGELLTGDTLVATATGSATNVADTAEGNNPIAEGYKIMHGEEDVTANYVITPVAGTLTIDPKAVTVTAQDKEFTYTGEAQSWPEYDVDGLIGDDAISAVVTGSITFPSESPVTNKLESYEFTTGTAGNYTVTTADGELTMKNASAAITITAASQTWTYDGKAHTNSEVTVTNGELLPGDELVATATGSATNVVDTRDGNNPIAEGYKIMHGDEDVTANYVITPVAGTLTIKPKAVTVTAQNKEFTYTGEAQSWPEYDVEGLVGDDAISAVVTGSITFPSESPATNELTSYEFTNGAASNYNVTTVNGELTMKTAEVAITITAADHEWTYDSNAHTNTEVTVTKGKLLEGDELVAEATGSVINVADTEEGNNPIAEGYKIMHGEEDVTANYVITPVAGTLTIKPKAVTVTAKSEEFTYDGTAHSNDGYDVDGLVGEDAISAVVTGSITFPSESPVTNKLESYEFTTGTPGNYDVTTADGELTMTNASAAITITAASQAWTYDGKAHSNAAVTVTKGELLEGDELVAEATGSATDVADTAAGNNPIKAGYKVMHGDEDVTANYVITTEAGTLTINPKAVTVTAKSEAFTYDGTAHSNAGYDVDGLVGEDALTAVVEGTITFPSESPVANVVKSHEFTKGTAGNYTVSYENGELTMTNASVAITITAASQEWTYDGATHTNTAVTVTKGELLEGDELVAEATGSATNVADTAEGNNPIAEGYKVMHGEEDVTANYDITAEAGTLTINPKEVTITAKNQAFIYDGKAHSYPEYDVDGLVGDDAITAVVEGTITYVSESPVANVVKSHEFTKGTAGNYTVSYVDGELTMTNAEVAITITAASEEWMYDGKAHSNNKVTVTEGELLEGDKLVAEATGSVTDVADTAAIITRSRKATGSCMVMKM